MCKLIASVAMVALSLTATAQQTVTCSARKARARFCPANTRNGVVLTEERSDNLCEEGRTWVVSRRGITVKGGCSAVFQLGGGTVANAYGNGTNGGNGGYNNGQNQAGSNGYPNGNDRDGNNRDGNNRAGNNGNQPGYIPNGNNANGTYNNGANGNNGYPQNNNGNAQNNNNGYPQNNNGSVQNNNNGYPQNGNNGSPQNNNGRPQNNSGYPQNGSGNSYPNGNNQPGYNNNDTQNRNSNGQDRDRHDGDRGYGDGRREGVVLPAGTRMDVRLEQTVNSSSVNQGDLVAGILVNDITMNGQTVAQAGTAVQAKIVSTQRSPLDMRLDSITIQGRSYPLATNSVHSVRDSLSTPNTGKESRGEQIGSILGALEGGTELPRGSVYSFRLVSAARVGQTR